MSSGEQTCRDGNYRRERVRSGFGHVAPVEFCLTPAPAASGHIIASVASFRQLLGSSTSTVRPTALRLLLTNWDETNVTGRVLAGWRRYG